LEQSSSKSALIPDIFYFQNTPEVTSVQHSLSFFHLTVTDYFLYRALEAACVAYAALNLLHYITSVTVTVTPCIHCVTKASLTLARRGVYAVARNWRGNEGRTRDSVRGAAWRCVSGEVVRTNSWRKSGNVQKIVSKRRHGANYASPCRIDRLRAIKWHEKWHDFARHVAGHCGNKNSCQCQVSYLLSLSSVILQL